MSLLALVAVASATGCAECCARLDRCACLLDGSHWAGCGEEVCTEASCPIIDGVRAHCPAKRLKKLCEKPTPGPPPVRYQPPLPPKFLPVPTAPTVVDVPCDSPVYAPAEVEFHYGQPPRLTFEAGD